MRNDLLILSVVIFLNAGCATNGNPSDSSGPEIDRISTEELARIVPKPLAKLSMDDLVRLTNEGDGPEQIIEKIKASDSMYDLTPSQSVALSRRGVDTKVLDYIHASRELALRNNLADEILKREKEKRAEVEKLKNQLWRQQRFYDPYCHWGNYGLMPYGYGGFGSHHGTHFGLGTGFGWPGGCW